MQSKIMLYGSEGRERLKKGIDALANMVKVTLGPGGRNVVLDRHYGGPQITKDGVTVAREIYLKDVVENMGAELVRSVASRTAEVAGDGTTTATVLAQAIVQEGIKNVTAGANPMDLKRGIDAAVVAVVEKLKEIKRDVSTEQEIIQVGAISSNNDRSIGELLNQAMQRVGKEGVITIEDSKTFDTSLEVVEGMQFDRGYLSHFFVTDAERMEAELLDVDVMLYDGRLGSIDIILPVLQQITQQNRSILVIAEEVEGDVIKTLVINKMKGNLKACAVKAPGFGERRKEVLEDIAILTGGKVVSVDMGTKVATLQDLGHAEKITIGRDATTIMGGAGKAEAIEARVGQLKRQIELATSDYDKQKFQERLAKLTGGVAVLRVGAATETELKERKDRIEDALHATRAAVEEGIVPGGGVAYIRALVALPREFKLENEDQNIGVDIVRRALRLPLITIAQNAGVSGEVVANTVMANIGAYGFDAQNDVYVDMFEAGIVDPTKVVRVALENAASIAGLFLTTEGVVAESPEYKAELEKMMNQPPAM
jgi:chaperonin GroEL